LGRTDARNFIFPQISQHPSSIAQVDKHRQIKLDQELVNGWTPVKTISESDPDA